VFAQASGAWQRACAPPIAGQQFWFIPPQAVQVPLVQVAPGSHAVWPPTVAQQAWPTAPQVPQLLGASPGAFTQRRGAVQAAAPPMVEQQGSAIPPQAEQVPLTHELPVSQAAAPPAVEQQACPEAPHMPQVLRALPGASTQRSGV
jgi:hypothetical protein